MAQEAQYASLDGTAFHGEENEFQPNPNAIARRSVSIFSRRGTETPEPKPPFIAQAAMPSSKEITPKQMGQKQKKWVKRKSVPASSSSPTKPKCTILNAVPPAKMIQMTPLEEEMANSPNEEILSAIGGSPATSVASKSVQNLVSPISPSTGNDRRSTSSLSQRTKSERRRDTNTRIGVWVHGVAHWDDQTRQEGSGLEEPSLQAATGFTPVIPNAAEKLNKTRTSRPSLSVVIPGRERSIEEKTISTVVEPMSKRPVVSVAPAGIVSKFATSTPSITIEEPHVDLSLDSISPHRPSPPPDRPSAPVDAASTNTIGQKKSRSSSSLSSSDHDDASDYSNRSSATSLENLAANGTPDKGKQKVSPDVNKPLPPNPTSRPQLEAPAPPSSPTEGKAARNLSTKSAPGGKKHNPFYRVRHMRSTRSMSKLDLSAADSPTLSEAEDDLEAHLLILTESNGDKKVSREEVTHDANGGIATKESKQEEVVEESEFTVAKSGSIRRSGSVSSVMHPPERTPTIPRRSRKRDWRASQDSNPEVQLPGTGLAIRKRSEINLRRSTFQQDDSNILRKSASATELSRVNELATLLRTPTEDLPPPKPKIVIDDGLIVLHGPVKMQAKSAQEPPVSSASAEDVLLQILTALDDTKDLFNTALINKAMHRVYKENELDLIRTVSLNKSPAAWEFREWCPPDENDDDGSSKSSSQLEHTPMSYMRSCRSDMAVIESLKVLILERCQTFIRRETAFALSTPTHPNAQRFNDAFWRIWCFCKIFGSGKGREEDVTGQLDWLKGGILANNQDLTATMNMNLEYDMISVLLNPPEFFAKGNEGGLSAQQLYDMTEIWTCLRSLLEGFHCRTEQAWENGVFDQCEIGIGDTETEELLLEEWTAYLLTLGPSVVLDMAEFAGDESSAGFALAKVNGWTTWSPPDNGTRSAFLKEPVSRLYEERVTAAAKKLQNPREQEKKDMSRKRVATLAAEIKLARQSSAFKRLPVIDMSMERPWSAMSRRSSTMSAHSARSQSPMQTQRQNSMAASSVGSRRTSAPVQHSSRVPNFSVPRPRSPPVGLWAPRKISPIIEERVETFNRMSLQNFAEGVAEDTSDRAVRRIMDMGFTAIEAREALRRTDMGDGLRVDRAVDLLLRQHE